MAEYTYKDVIIDPDDPRIEIGAEYYSGDTPADCIALANSDKFDGSDRLTAVDKNRERPFAFGSDNESNVLWDVCIIRKKEPKKKYVPFDLYRPEGRDKLRGKWIREKETNNEYCINSFLYSCDGYCTANGWGGKTLLNSFEFLDGTPCGELEEVENEEADT